MSESRRVDFDLSSFSSPNHYRGRSHFGCSSVVALPSNRIRLVATADVWNDVLRAFGAHIGRGF